MASNSVGRMRSYNGLVSRGLVGKYLVRGANMLPHPPLVRPNSGHLGVRSHWYCKYWDDFYYKFPINDITDKSGMF